MNVWIEKTLLPLVCAFGLGVAVTANATRHAAEHAAPAQPEHTQASSEAAAGECPPFSVPARPSRRVIVAEARP